MSQKWCSFQAGRALYAFSEAFRHGMDTSLSGADPSRMECRFEAYLQILVSFSAPVPHPSVFFHLK